MPNYSNGKIYTIRFHNSNEIYIGSTIQSIPVRFGSHKRKNNSAVYRLINDKYEGNWEECYYELYENYSCDNKEELHKKEGEIIRKFKDDENYDCINCRIAGRTQSEYNIQYRKNNLDKENERYKTYYDKNKDKIICECGSCVGKINLIKTHYKSKKHQNYLSSLCAVI
jgi:hypothetical protein